MFPPPTYEILTLRKEEQRLALEVKRRTAEVERMVSDDDLSISLIKIECRMQFLSIEVVTYSHIYLFFPQRAAKAAMQADVDARNAAAAAARDASGHRGSG